MASQNKGQAGVDKMDAEKRMQYLVEQVRNHGVIWILTDQHGAVMLNTDDEDGVPVWPAKEFAEQWATGEWSDCEPMAISLNDWRSRWTPGLEDDELSVVVFPLEGEEGLVLYPEELDEALT